MSEQTPPQFSPAQLRQVSDFFAEGRAAHEAATDVDSNLEVLKSVPGVDPVLAVVEGRPGDIPQDGWVVNSHIAPGYGGVINIYRYKEGSLTPSPYDGSPDSREKWGEARVHFGLEGEYGSHTVIYENPLFPQKDVDPCERLSETSYAGLRLTGTDAIDLDNGGRILDEKDPMVIGGRGGTFFGMDWEDIDKKLGKTGKATETDINRVTADPEQFRQILAHLGYSMGMTEQGIQSLVGTVDQKVAAAA